MVWMAENLNYEYEGSLCYKNEENNCPIYGRLYVWSDALDVCPEGWHLLCQNFFPKAQPNKVKKHLSTDRCPSL